MKCYYHSENEAVGVCNYCGRFTCSQCNVVKEKTSFCSTCYEMLFEEIEDDIPTSEVRVPNWFARHLNWTALLTWLIWLPIYLVVVPLVGSAIASLIKPYITWQAVLVVQLATLVPFLVWILPTNIWILRRKDRSLWWLLLAPLSTIGLENRSKPPVKEQPELTQEEKKERLARVAEQVSRIASKRKQQDQETLSKPD